jgi:glucose-1-phosphate thymidylyltransferase
MKGVILAGGTGSRLDPLTRTTNKHLLRVHDRSMIRFAVEQLAGCGIDEVMVVTGENYADAFENELRSPRSFGLREIRYGYQRRAGGIAEALGLCEVFASDGPIVVLLGDNIFEYSAAPLVERFRAAPRGARIVLARVDNPAAYGVAVMDGDRLVRIVEKPATPLGNLAVTGLYLYDRRVFEIVKELRPSARGELEITDVNNRYLELGELGYEQVAGYWVDCGESIAMLTRASELVAERGANKPRQ